jgi:hypothetical protein
MAKKVMESNVISRWGVLAEGQAGKENRFFELIKQRLSEYGWPYPLRTVDVGSGFLSAKRAYLETGASKLIAYIGAESIGKNAYFTWSLTLAEPGLFKKAVIGSDLATLLYQRLSFNEANSARAFASSLNRCVQEAVDIIMDEAGLDTSKISREASGPLGRII